MLEILTLHQINVKKCRTALPAASRSGFGVGPNFVRREFGIAGPVIGFRDVADIGGGLDRDGPVRDTGLPGDWT